MQALDHDEVSMVIAASPDTLYALVADVTRMPEFSPELRECRWLDGATEATVGVRFAARNKSVRGPSWAKKPVITTAEPGREISWSRTEAIAGTVEWSYRFDEQEGGTLVIESYRVTKPIPWLGRLVIGMMSPGDRREALRQGMEQTLLRIKATVQATEQQGEPPATG